MQVASAKSVIEMGKDVEAENINSKDRRKMELFRASFLSRPVSPLSDGSSLPVGPSLPDLRIKKRVMLRRFPHDEENFIY